MTVQFTRALNLEVLNLYDGAASPTSAEDANLLARLVLQLDMGLDAYPRLDPQIVGDITGNGMLSAFDAALLSQ